MHHSITPAAGLICSQQATNQVPALAVGCFKLSAGRAMSLTPNVAGELRIAHGSVWVTFGHAADEAAIRAGDYFFDAGDLLRLLPGQQLVMEVHQQNTDKDSFDCVYFSWEPHAAMSPAASSRRPQHAPVDVQQLLRELGGALHHSGKALGRLARGVAAYLACALMRRHIAVR